jgi:putative component of membrane protein insertase Oxa1/YidC/SpoIIIJ protein YidD
VDSEEHGCRYAPAGSLYNPDVIQRHGLGIVLGTFLQVH